MSGSDRYAIRKSWRDRFTVLGRRSQNVVVEAAGIVHAVHSRWGHLGQEATHTGFLLRHIC